MTAWVDKNEYSIIHTQLRIFCAPRNHGRAANNMSELNKPSLEKTRIELENILRWEDDGGRILNVGNAITPSIINMARESAKRMLNIGTLITGG
jgi:hypothetical protein